ncbi:hypothetical protein I4F81_011483 [Pyropia yezoensis]|uniref:Uncharacterized protein n=1 Tax=Pyropia yezoensis TaxID=2788 RepID=A0ACC3CGV9_PYRYE|nr:hypothetical protein I4F81_011483 [Neopyropia yezoensis]
MGAAGRGSVGHGPARGGAAVPHLGGGEGYPAHAAAARPLPGRRGSLRPNGGRIRRGASGDHRPSPWGQDKGNGNGVEGLLPPVPGRPGEGKAGGGGGRARRGGRTRCGRWGESFWLWRARGCLAGIHCVGHPVGGGGPPRHRRPHHRIPLGAGGHVDGSRHGWHVRPPPAPPAYVHRELVDGQLFHPPRHVSGGDDPLSVAASGVGPCPFLYHFRRTAAGVGSDRHVGGAKVGGRGGWVPGPAGRRRHPRTRQRHGAAGRGPGREGGGRHRPQRGLGRGAGKG